MKNLGEAGVDIQQEHMGVAGLQATASQVIKDTSNAAAKDRRQLGVMQRWRGLRKN